MSLRTLAKIGRAVAMQRCPERSTSDECVKLIGKNSELLILVKTSIVLGSQVVVGR